MFESKWVVDRVFPRGTVWDLVDEEGELFGYVQKTQEDVISVTYGTSERSLTETGWTSLQAAARNVMRNLGLTVRARPCHPVIGWDMVK